MWTKTGTITSCPGHTQVVWRAVSFFAGLTDTAHTVRMSLFGQWRYSFRKPALRPGPSVTLRKKMKGLASQSPLAETTVFSLRASVHCCGRGQLGHPLHWSPDPVCTPKLKPFSSRWPLCCKQLVTWKSYMGTCHLGPSPGLTSRTSSTFGLLHLSGGQKSTCLFLSFLCSLTCSIPTTHT